MPGDSSTPPAGPPGSADRGRGAVVPPFADHCLPCADARFYGRAWGHPDPHLLHTALIGHGPRVGTACACTDPQHQERRNVD